VDSHCFPGWTISPFYDSLIAKLIVWAPDRDGAIDRLERALGEFSVEGRGIRTTIPFHRRVLADPRFRAGDVFTDFVAGMADRATVQHGDADVAGDGEVRGRS
jgi:acetyl-CoA carboxylase biotin carboxylase subunit